MDKRLLIRHIKNEATPKEREEVLAWLDQSEENEAYYIRLMNTVLQEQATREYPAGAEIPIGMKQEAFRQIKERIAATAQGTTAVPVLPGKNKPNNWWKWSSCAAAVLLAASVMMNIYQFGGLTGGESVATMQKVPAVTDLCSTYYTENGVKGRIILPDSSIVWLNSGSRITYPDHFDSDKRRVSFEGEGYFDVMRNPQWPMEVVTPKGMKVVVLGTKFHIKSYDNDEEEQATLFSGRIDISKSDGTRSLAPKVLKPKESLRFTPEGSAVFTASADTTKKVAWKRGELLFEQTPMSEVVKMLERWHGVEVIVEDPVVLSYKFTASFTSESIVQIMELFRFTSPLDYNIDEQKVYLRKRKI